MFNIFVNNIEIEDGKIILHFTYKVYGILTDHKLIIHDDLISNDYGEIGEKISILARIDEENWSVIIGEEDQISLKFNPSTISTGIKASHIGYLLRAHYQTEDYNK